MSGDQHAMDAFSAPVREWFVSSFQEPTPPQEMGWPAIARGENTLILSPTGSGKTLAAFLWGIDRLMTQPVPDREQRTRLLYISPLRALAVDVEKNLRSPLKGIALAAERSGTAVHVPTVGMRTGDTPADQRRKLVRNPPDLLITTPESLYLMLTSAARETLRNVDAVIIDEIHSVAGTKRGAHLALTLERLEHLTSGTLQRIGLSATQRPLDEIARFLGGKHVTGAEPEARRLEDQSGVVGRTSRQGAAVTGAEPEARRLEDQSGVVGRTSRQGAAVTGAEPEARRLEDQSGVVGRTSRQGAAVTGAEPEARRLEDQSGVVGRTSRQGSWRNVEIVDASAAPNMDIEVVVPIEDMAHLGTMEPEPGADPMAPPQRRSIWPSVHPRILEQIQQHDSTIVFVNSRRLAERLAGRLNELWDEQDEQSGNSPAPFGVSGAEPEAKRRAEVDDGRRPEVPTSSRISAHHGSLSKERRLDIEDALKQGQLRAIVATSSLELGIDMGAVDLVIQVESPGAVSRGLQRIGRAGHQVGQVSEGKIFPKHRADLLETAVVVDRMRDAKIEKTKYLRNPLDVLAQHIVAMTALDDWPLDELTAVVRSSATFAELSDDVLNSVLDLLAGRYPSEEFGELRPRIVWDRVGNIIRGRKGAQRLAVTNAGTIPDRGLYGVFLPDGTRVGELDEEMVYESRPGETFLLGASTWRIEDITFERVVVTPAPGEPGKMPFWHGDGPGRPLELGQALGEFVRELATMSADDAMKRLTSRHGLDELAAANLIQYVDDQREATGIVPDDKTIVVERFRDEIGDWRVCVLSPFGAQVHAPWGMALRSKLSEQWGTDVEMMWSDDGIVIRLPEAFDEIDIDALRIDADQIDELVVAELPGSALFASRFRECAARSLLLPRRRPDQRTPLWQQRQRSADLLKVAAKYPSFPILLEATRECLNDVFDVPALREVLTGLSNRSIRMVEVETSKASPFAQSLLFGWIAQYMYEGDAPLAERRAAALSLDRDLLRDLLGAEELRELLDAGVLADLELELQRLVDGRRARDADEIHDLLRLLGPLDRHEIEARSVDECDVGAAIEGLLGEQRVIEIGVADDRRYAAADDAGRLRDAIGVAIPPGLPMAFTESVDHPLEDLVMRFGRTHGPFVARQIAERYGVPLARVEASLDTLTASGSLVRGEFRPGGSGREWVDEGVLRQLRRRSLAALRAEVAPVEQSTLARFLPQWQGVGVRRRGADGLAEVIGVLQGAPLPASALERSILPARMAHYQPGDLDQLCTTGEVVWTGAGAIGSKDGRIRLAFRDQAALLISPTVEPPGEPTHDLIREHLATAGASFWSQIVQAVAAGGEPYADAEVLAALWDLVWAGEVTNDSLAPVRAFVGRKSRAAATRTRRRPRVGQLRASGPPTSVGRWSLVAPLLQPQPAATTRATAQALQLVERYGVLSREAALGEGITGGFAGVYPVLKALEDRGDLRRGYFVEGLGAAQFALPGAVDRLRGSASPSDDDGSRAVVLAATDPAQPYGASLRWPESPGRPARAAEAYVVIVDGQLAVYLERGGKSMLTFAAARESDAWVEPLIDLVRNGTVRTLELAKVDGEPTAESSLVEALTAHGFIRAYKGFTWIKRPS